MRIAFDNRAIATNRLLRGGLLTTLFLLASTLAWWLGDNRLATILALIGCCFALVFTRLILASRHAPNLLEIDEGVLTSPISIRFPPREVDLKQLTNWQILDQWNPQTLVGSSPHTGLDFRRKLFQPKDWQRLLTAFETHAGPPQQLAPYPMHWFWTAFFVTLCVLHYFSISSTSSTSPQWVFELLGNGAANQHLVYAGDAWRLLSANFTHAHLPHLFVNLAATMLLAAQLGNRFRAIEFMGLVITVGVLCVGTTMHIPRVTLVLGASTITYGMFGFLLAAQRAGDQRLHPWHRVHSSNGLLAMLVAEFTMAILITGYGAAVHIVGLIVGYIYYHLFVWTRASYWSTARLVAQSVIVLAAIPLALQSVTERSAWLGSNGSELALKLIAHPDFRLTTVGGLALLDQPSTTQAQVTSLLAQAERYQYKGQAMNLVKARAHHWQGNTQLAHQLLFDWIGQDPTGETSQNLLGAVARELRLQQDGDLGPTVNALEPGEGTAVLLNHTQDRLAFVSLTNDSQQIAERLPKHPFYSWHLLTIYPETPFPKGAKLAHSWYLERTHYPTRATASSLRAAQPRPAPDAPES